MKNITDQTVKETIANSSKLLIIDLWAQWCSPCRSLGPKLEELNNENSATTEIVKLDVDENPQTPTDYGVRGIPTVLFFKNGQHVDTFVGNQSKESIQAMIDKHK
jgi:thioredoxin 1